MSPLLDCYNGEIISLAMDTNMKKELCIKTITEAYKNFDIQSGAIILKRLRKPVYKLRVQKDARTAACCPEYERSWQMFLKNATVEETSVSENYCILVRDKRTCEYAMFALSKLDVFLSGTICTA